MSAGQSRNDLISAEIPPEQEIVFIVPVNRSIKTILSVYFRIRVSVYNRAVMT